MKLIKRILPDLIAILAFIIIPTIYFAPAAFEGRILVSVTVRSQENITKEPAKQPVGATPFSAVCPLTKVRQAMILRIF